VAGPLRLAAGRWFSAAAVVLCSGIQLVFLRWPNSAIDPGCLMDYVRFHRLALGTKPFAGLAQTNDFWFLVNGLRQAIVRHLQLRRPSG
jgi:hypothetical protein